jgi:hypothetical protein
MLGKEINNDAKMTVLWMRLFNAKARIKNGEKDQVDRFHHIINTIGDQRRLLLNKGIN